MANLASSANSANRANPAAPQFIDEYDEAFERDQRAVERRRRFAVTIDFPLILTVGVLIAIGLMMIWSTTFFWAEPQGRLFQQQATNAVFGLALMLAVSVIDYHIWRKLATLLMGVALLLLVLVLLFGTEVFGARRAFFGGAVQPAEIASMIVVIYMAAWLSSRQNKLRRLSYGLLPFGALVGSIAGLIALEPDLSTAGMVLLTASIMFFLAGADWLQIGATAAFFLGGGFLALNTFSYARSRIELWIELLQNPIQSQASHAQNVIVAFLNGGLSGVGLGQGYQKFANLPAPHTDSIFAVVGEELGLIGCALIVGLFLVLMWRGFKIARNAPDLFGALLAAGITIEIVVEALFNIAVMSNVVPLVGVPLPFISFGGSALVSSMFGVGLIMSVARVTARKAVPKRRVNETLTIPGMRSPISRVRQRPIEE
jgi:cell division protein FtsW